MEGWPWWAQFLAGGGLLAVGVFVTKTMPQVIAFITGKAAIDKAYRESAAAQLLIDRQQFENERKAERQMELDRIADLVKQLNDAQSRVLVQAEKSSAALLVETEKRAAAASELATLKAGIGSQLTRIETQGNGAKKALEDHVASLLEELRQVKQTNINLAAQVNRAEEASAEVLKVQQNPP